MNKWKYWLRLKLSAPLGENSHDVSIDFLRFEAFPQLFLQAYFSVWYFDDIPFITGLSIFFSIMNLARSVNHYEDIYGVIGRPRSFFDQAVTHALLRLWRTTEIFFRIFLFIYVASSSGVPQPKLPLKYITRRRFFSFQKLRCFTNPSFRN